MGKTFKDYGGFNPEPGNPQTGGCGYGGGGRGVGLECVPLALCGIGSGGFFNGRLVLASEGLSKRKVIEVGWIDCGRSFL